VGALVDNTGQSTGGTSTAGLTISSFAVGSGPNRFIKIEVEQYSNPDRVPSATFNGTENFVVDDAVTIAESPGTRRITTLKLVNPSIVTAPIAVSWPGAVDEAVVGATSWTNVDQTTPLSAAVKASGTTGTSSSLSIPNAVGDVVHSAIAVDAVAAAEVVANQTQRYRALAAANTTEGAAQTANGTGSPITCTWSSFFSGATFAHIGYAIKAAAGGAAVSTQAPQLMSPMRPLRAAVGGLIGRLALALRAAHLARSAAAAAPQTFTLPLSVGTYSLTGQSVGLATTHRVPLAAGVYSLTGQNVALYRALSMPAVVGTYALNGQAVRLAASRRIALANGTYALNGQAVALRASRALPLANAAYVLNGQPVRLAFLHRIVLANGVYSLAGQTVTLTKNSSVGVTTLTAGVGAYALTGKAVALRASRRLAVAAGIFTLTGIDVRLGVAHLDDVGTILPSRGIVERRFGAIRTRNRPGSVLVDRAPTTGQDVVGDSWIPDDSSGAGLSLSVIAEACRLVRAGGLVYAFFAIVLPATGNAAPAAISLPVIARDTLVPVAPVTWSYISIADVTGVVVNGATQFNLYHTDGSPVTNAQLSGKVLRGCAIYEAAS
jgi:hypothetical protein